MTDTTSTMSASTAAAYLAEALSGTPEAWMTWLANDRKPNRVKRWLPVEAGPGRPRYAKASVDGYISSIRAEVIQKERAATESPPRKERRLVLSIAAVTEEDGADVPRVAFICARPLMAYNLSAAEARNIARRLNQAADVIDPPVTD